MKIITTTTIEVSEENEPFIAYIVAKNWGTMGEETTEEAVIRLRNFVSFTNAFGQIAPHIWAYFWDAGKDKTEIIVNALNNGAITVETIIE